MKNILLTAVCLACGYFYSYGSIPSVLAEVEENNGKLQSQRHLTEAQILEARTGNLPGDLEAEYVLARSAGAGTQRIGEITVKQNFDFPSVYSAKAKNARLKTYQYGYEYSVARQELMLEVYDLCIEIVALQRLLEVLELSLESLANTTGITRARYERGDIGILDLHQAEFEYTVAGNEIDMVRVELADAVSRLRTLNGGNDPVRLPDSFPVIERIAPLEQMKELWTEFSPMLQALRAEAESARQEVKISKRENLPGLAVGYRHEYAPGEKFNGVVMGVSIPLFAGKNKVKAASALARYARTEAAAAEQELISELEGLYRRKELLDSAVGRMDSNEERTREAAGVLTRALESGHISLAEYFQKLTPVYEAELKRIDMLRELHLVNGRIMVLDL